ncbi:MAG: hypothetical protein AAEJ04_11220, partial [Planctomycetota bacterium]
DDPCAVSDLDQDGDVDADDLAGLQLAYLDVPEDCDNDGSWDLIQILVGGGDTNNDGILDACAGSDFRRGDGNADGSIDIGDAVFTLGILFGGTGPPTCSDSNDANDDGAFDISDAIYTLSFLFGSGPAMPAPGSSTCGPDPTADALECNSYAGCP